MSKDKMRPGLCWHSQVMVTVLLPSSESLFAEMCTSWLFTLSILLVFAECETFCQWATGGD